MKNITIGSEVAFNTLADATWFKVEAINGFNLTVREAGTEYATQTIDKCAVKMVREGNGYKFGVGQHVAIHGGAYDGENGQVRELLKDSTGARSYGVKVLTGPDRGMKGTCVISERDLRPE